MSVPGVTLDAVATRIPPQLLEVAEMQRGIVTKRQAVAAGLTRSVIASHVPMAGGSGCIRVSTRLSLVGLAVSRCYGPRC
jgi:hypothetical protein